jgi:UPF0755 protein
VRWSSHGRFLLHGLLIAVVTAASLGLVTVFSPAGFHDRAFVYVVIEPGLSFSQIAARFSDAGLVKNRDVFLVLGRIFRIERRAKAGRYRFRSTADMADILHVLYHGATYREQVLIRPGMTIRGVAQVLSRQAEVDSTAFVTLAADSAFVSRLGVPSLTAEGFLFPDTYDVEWREDAATVMGRMVRRFFRVFDDSLRARAEQMGMTITEAVTLASIIEKEAMLDSERPHISAVFHNRLDRGMKLQADPTVRYALGKWSGRILYSDLKVASPFNTYLVYGLPPRPICNPGLPSIVAALYPFPGSMDLYFVARGDGSHFFSQNAREHNTAIARYRAYLKEQATQPTQEPEADDGAQAPD